MESPAGGESTPPPASADVPVKAFNPSKNVIKVFEISEKQRTARWAIVASAVVIGLGIIAWMMKAIFTQPQWVQFATILQAILFGSPMLTPVVRRLYLNYTAKAHKRVVELEIRLDPRRTSSVPDRKPKGK